MNLTFIAIYPLIAALLAGEGKFLDRNSSWNSKDDQQKIFVDKYFTKKSEIKWFSFKESKSCISKDVKELNEAAQKRNVDSVFKKFDNSNQFGIFSTFTYDLKNSRLIPSYISFGNNKYFAIEVDSNFEILESEKYEKLFVKLELNSEDTLFLVNAEKKDKNLKDFDLISKINNLHNCSKHKSKANYSAVIFPQFQINVVNKLSFLNDLNTTKGILKQAYQHIIFKIILTEDDIKKNQQQTFYNSLLQSFNVYLYKDKLIVNEPFFVWIKRKGYSLPILMGYIDKENWIKEKSILERATDKLDLYF